MPELSANYWLLIVIVVLVGILAIWRVFAATRRTRVELDRAPEDAAPRRNQALIDAAPAATPAPVVPPPTPQGLAGVGEVVAAAAEPEPVAAAAVEATGGDDLTRIKG